jgi:hypothetical protein
MAAQKVNPDGVSTSNNGMVEYKKRDTQSVRKKLKKLNGKTHISVEDDVNILERPEIVNHKELLHVLTEVKNGNFNVRMPIDQIGLNGKICDVLNDIY